MTEYPLTVALLVMVLAALTLRPMVRRYLQHLRDVDFTRRARRSREIDQYNQVTRNS